MAGLKLTSKYKNNSDLTTATFDYYGFDYDAWKKASNEGDKLIQYDNYGFRCSIEMKENRHLGQNLLNLMAKPGDKFH
ncbi:hypothetical protein KE530_14820 [Clostridiaceae bacterium Marseille-Q4145]|nr:hypothetical protein [Clostridiaceae bacterium Marseille-Q4145]